MNILVINCGSSSLKYHLYNMITEKLLFIGLIERIGLDNPLHRFGKNDYDYKEEVEISDHTSAIKLALQKLTSSGIGPLKSLSDINAVAHRVVHGGERFQSATVVTDDNIEEMEKYNHFAPLHNPIMIHGIKECRRLLPNVQHVAVFDTAFHHSIPAEARLFGIPYKYYEEGVKRYGFHGNSHQYVAMKAAEYLQRSFRRFNVITCHLGNGSSVCAVSDGRSLDTSMGMSPMDGLIMGTRCGQLDPFIIFHLMREFGHSAEEIEEMLNKKSGLLGISGISSDFRDVHIAAEKGNNRAQIAIMALEYQLKKYIGAYCAVLGRVDAIVFTGGIGQNSVELRWRALQGLERLG
ncbi:MAG: acetate kinase, partial [Nitrospirae bacterium]